jgi:hypothetical protein
MNPTIRTITRTATQLWAFAKSITSGTVGPPGKPPLHTPPTHRAHLWNWNMCQDNLTLKHLERVLPVPLPSLLFLCGGKRRPRLLFVGEDADDVRRLAALDAADVHHHAESRDLLAGDHDRFPRVRRPSRLYGPAKFARPWRQ